MREGQDWGDGFSLLRRGPFEGEIPQKGLVSFGGVEAREKPRGEPGNERPDKEIGQAQGENGGEPRDAIVGEGGEIGEMLRSVRCHTLYDW